MQNIDYFYDSQIRTHILHIGRIFMGFQISTGKNPKTGEDLLQTVPCRFIASDRQVANLLNNVSENIIHTAPFITYHISNLDIARDRTQVAHEMSTETVYERKWNSETQQYENDLGSVTTVDRMNPVPIELTIKLNIWTTKLTHKLQLFEQLRTLFNPSIELQMNTNVVDWTNTVEIELEDVDMSSRTTPYGSDDNMDLMEMTFKVQSYINPPATATRSRIIKTIIDNIGEGDCIYDVLGWRFPDDISRTIRTPKDMYINIDNIEGTDYITLLDAFGKPSEKSWIDFIRMFGAYKENETQIRLRALTYDIEDNSNDIIGTIKLVDDEPQKLQWTMDIDTLPTDSLQPINNIIEPHRMFPGKGLPVAENGQRYLITDDIKLVDKKHKGSQTNIGKELLGDSIAWGNISAKKWDIIEYNETDSKWNVVFDSSIEKKQKTVVSLGNQTLYEWDFKNGWISPIRGTWKSGWWSLVFQNETYN